MLYIRKLIESQLNWIISEGASLNIIIWLKYYLLYWQKLEITAGRDFTMYFISSAKLMSQIYFHLYILEFYHTNSPLIYVGEHNILWEIF